LLKNHSGRLYEPKRMDPRPDDEAESDASATVNAQ